MNCVESYCPEALFDLDEIEAVPVFAVPTFYPFTQDATASETTCTVSVTVANQNPYDGVLCYVQSPLGLWGVQFGGFNIGAGDPWLIFDQDAAMAYSRGGQGVANAFTGGLFWEEYGLFYDKFNEQWEDLGYENNECNKDFKTGMTGGRVAEAALLAAGGLKAAGVDPWLGDVVRHGAHGGGPHQYRHLQIMLRAGKHVTKHIRIPLP